MNALLKKFLTYVLAVLFILASWHLGAIILDRPFLPPPHLAVLNFFQILVEGTLHGHFLISTYRVLASILIAFLLAVPLGLALGMNKMLDKLIAPVVYVLYPLPKIVFLPVIVVLMGLGNLPKIFLITLIIFFQVVVTTRDAAKSIPYQNIQAIRSLNPSTWQIYIHLVVPFCLPKILTSIRISLGTAVAVLFFAETFASTDGLGYLILDAMERREYGAMYAGIIAMGLLGLILYGLVDYAERIFCKWQKL